MLIVLSLESLLSGSALGVASNYVSALVVFIAIVAHIWAGAFALCASFLKSALTDRQIYKLLTIFCSITPVGILCGIALRHDLEGHIVHEVTAVLMAFAAGTFLYVGIIEMLHEELSKKETPNKLIKIGLVLAGFGFMAIIPVFVD